MILPSIFQNYKPLDFAVIALVLAASVSLSLKGGAAAKTPVVRVNADGREYIFSLSEDGIFSVQGKNGETVLEIKGEMVRILDSACPEKTCAAQGFISSGKIVCLPNRVIVTAENGAKKGKTDAISR